MIAATYAISAVLLALTGWLFAQGQLAATSQTALWTVIFFFASAASSSAYLTVSEVFPVEMRGMAIALFYALGTAIGGTAAPGLFGRLIETGSRQNLFYGYLVASGLLAIAVVMTIAFGVKAEGASLEAIADPLSAGRRGRTSRHVTCSIRGPIAGRWRGRAGTGSMAKGRIWLRQVGRARSNGGRRTPHLRG